MSAVHPPQARPAPEPTPAAAAPPPPATAGWRWAWLADAAALTVLLAAVLVLFRDTLLHGEVFAEGDTRLFYYPLMRTVTERWLAGQAPLWTPGIFAGYPIFADGESGPLYPLNLLTRVISGPAGWFGALSVLHFLLAAAFGYVYGRSLALVRPAAAVVGAVFALGGFLIAQAHHTNVVASGIWLPLLLACIERARRAAERSGARLDASLLAWTMAGAGVYALAWLGVHIQPAIMSSMLLGLYVPWRFLTLPGRRRRAVQTALVLGGIVAVGAAVAAAQVLPLYELGAASRRAEPQTADFGNSYATPLWNLITLIVPFFFRTADGAGFDLWPRWEIALYVGIAPLLLAPLALLHGRRRSLTLLWLLVALGSLLCAFGGYLPGPLHGLLWELPGFSFLRAPGRFSYLFTLALAVLAAVGLDHLAGAALNRDPAARRRLGWAWLGLASAAALAAAGWLAGRAWLAGHQAVALGSITRRYLALEHAPIVPDAATVYNYLLAALSPYAPGTVTAAALLAVTLALIALACWRHPFAARTAPALLLVVTLADLVAYGHAFHPRLAQSDLTEPTPAARFLAAQPRDGRLFAFPGTEVEANQALPYGVAEIGGYSSLQSSRSIGYTGYLRAGDGALLDLADVRWLAAPATPAPTLAFEGTRFDVPRPLFSSGAGNPSAHAAFHVDADATELRLVTRLQNSPIIPQGTAVATITATAADGTRQRWPLRAGLESAEWAWERSDVRRQARHDLPPAAFTWQNDDDLNGSFQAHLYAARLALPAATRLVRVEVDYSYPVGRLQVNGLSLYDATTGAQVSLNRFDNGRFRLAWQDANTRVWENGQRAPRAFLVPEALTIRPAEQRDAATAFDTLGNLAEGDFDYHRAALVLDGPGDLPLARTSLPLPPASAPQPPGTAQIVGSAPEWLQVRLSAPGPRWLVVTDAYDPGWRATVDGEAAPLYRTDGLFRGLPVPPGEHLVEMRYVPTRLWPGVALSGATLCAIMVGWLAYFGRRRWRRRA